MKYVIKENTKASAIANTNIVAPTVIWCEGNAQTLIGLHGVADDTALSVKQETEVATAQDLYLEVQTPPVTTQAWVFKEVIDCSTYRSFDVNFISNGLTCNSLETWDDSRVMKYWSDILDVDVYSETSGWGSNVAKRLIILSEPASGSLLTFLNVYAVQLAANEFAVFEGEGSSASITKIKCNSGETFEQWQAGANNVDFGKGVARFVYNDMVGKDILTWNDGFVLQNLNGSYIGKSDIANALELYSFGRTPM